MLLADKVAVISGGASPRGIGLATARLLAQHGARIAILDLDQDDSRRLPRRRSARAIAASPAT